MDRSCDRAARKCTGGPRRPSKLFPGSAPTMASVLAHHYSSGGDAPTRSSTRPSLRTALQALRARRAESLLRLAASPVAASRNRRGPSRVAGDAPVADALPGRSLRRKRRRDQRERDSLLAGAPTGATASCLFWLAHGMLSRRARYQEAQHYARAAIDQARQLGDAATIGKAQGVLASPPVLSGRRRGHGQAGQSIATLQRPTSPTGSA